MTMGPLPMISTERMEVSLGMMECFARFQCRAWPERLFQIARKDSAAERDDQTEFKSCSNPLTVTATSVAAARAFIRRLVSRRGGFRVTSDCRVSEAGKCRMETEGGGFFPGGEMRKQLRFFHARLRE